MTLDEHPAYDVKRRALICPMCRELGSVYESVREAEFHVHFLAHGPGPELAKEFLAPEFYAVLALERGWGKSLSEVLGKIRKLLALSDSPNEHEAALAAARAAELMIRYQIDAAQLEADGGAGPAMIDQHPLAEMKKIVYWKATIAGGLTKAFGCALFFETVRRTEITKRKTKVNERHVKFVIIGRDSDVAAIRYMYRYLCKEVERLADGSFDARMRAKVPIASPRAYKNAYRSGAAAVICRRLVDERKLRKDEAMRAAVENDSMRRALVRLDENEAAVERYCDDLRAGGATNAKGRPTFSDAMGAADGIEGGKSVDLGTDKAGLTVGSPRLSGRRS